MQQKKQICKICKKYSTSMQHVCNKHATSSMQFIEVLYFACMCNICTGEFADVDQAAPVCLRAVSESVSRAEQHCLIFKFKLPWPSKAAAAAAAGAAATKARCRGQCRCHTGYRTTVKITSHCNQQSLSSTPGQCLICAAGYPAAAPGTGRPG